MYDVADIRHAIKPCVLRTCFITESNETMLEYVYVSRELFQMKIHALFRYVVSLLSHFVHFGSLLSQNCGERLQRNEIEGHLTKTGLWMSSQES